MLGGVEPKAECKVNFVPILVFKCFAGCGQECIYRRLVNFRVGLVTLALDSPKTSARRFCNEVDAHIFAAKLFLGKEVIPQPDFRKRARINRVGFQVTQHQQLELVAFVSLRNAFVTILVENACERQLVLKRLVLWHLKILFERILLLCT